jgi:hypothetical protein
MRKNNVDSFFRIVYVSLAIAMFWVSGYMFGQYIFVGKHSVQGINWTGLFYSLLSAFWGFWGLFMYHRTKH